MAAFRPIRPAQAGLDGTGEAFSGSGDGNPGPSQPGSNVPRRSSRVLQACNPCRMRKTKCDGARPTCRNCLALEISCGYEGAADKSRYGAIKSRLESLESLFDTLKMAPPNQADDLVRRIRSTGDISGVLQESDAADDPSGREGDATGASTDGEPGPSRQPAVPVGLSHLAVPSLSSTREAIDDFYASSGKLFHVFSSAQAAWHLSRALDDDSADADEKKISACCAFAVASVGTRYVPGKFDKALEETFYQLARHHFETIIERQPFNAIKVCTMLAMNNIMDKTTVALSYVEIGLSMARRHGLYEKTCPNRQSSPEEWIDYRRTWRTLIFFSSWLSSTLGYISGNDTLFQVPLSEMNVDNSEELEDVVQTEMAKISLLKVSILRLNLTFKDLSPLATESMTRDLQDWYEKLPAVMSLINLAQGTIPPAVRWSIYYIHLLYLGAIMLLYRRVASHLCQSFAPEQRRTILSQSFVEYLNGPVERGVNAAKQSATILGLIINNDGLFKRCWLVMFQSYTSAIALLHAAAQKQLHLFPHESWAEDLEQAAQCMAVLEYCGSIDRVANGFHTKLSPIYAKIASYSPPAPGVAGSATAQTPFLQSTTGRSSSAYLLDLPAHCDPDHVSVSASLLGMLCTPFGDPEARSIADEVAKVPGWRPEPTCYEHPQMVERLGLRLEDKMLLQCRDEAMEALPPIYGSGGFLGSPEPHGWSSGVP